LTAIIFPVITISEPMGLDITAPAITGNPPFTSVFPGIRPCSAGAIGITGTRKIDFGITTNRSYA